MKKIRATEVGGTQTKSLHKGKETFFSAKWNQIMKAFWKRKRQSDMEKMTSILNKIFYAVAAFKLNSNLFIEIFEIFKDRKTV